MKRVVMVGVSHQTAPMEVRERLTFAGAAGAGELRAHGAVSEAVILATCNRSEVYAVIDHRHGIEPVREWYANLHGMALKDVEEWLYDNRDCDAVRHLFRVASGLDSLLLGEAEILGQVREAYKAALEQQTTGAVLNRLFQSALEAGKRVRTHTDLGTRPMSVAFAGVKLAERVFGKLSGRHALLLGAGAVAEQVAEHMRNRGLGKLCVANRTAERGAELARRFCGQAVAWEGLEQALREPEIVVSSVGGAERVLTQAMIEKAMAARGNRDLFIVDLGVPRNVEPNIRDLYNVFLYDLDDLSAIVEQNKEARKNEIPRAEAIVAEHVGKFQIWMASVEIVHLVLALREKMRHEQEEILHEHMEQFDDLTPQARRQAARKLQALVDRIMQEPASEGDAARLLRGDVPELREVRAIMGLAGKES